MTAWLDERGQAWKDTVQIVAMDPCASYRAAVREALPNARIVADHFHLVRLANQAVTDVPRREHGSPALDDHVGPPPAEVKFPLKFEEPR